VSLIKRHTAAERILLLLSIVALALDLVRKKTKMED
jgi:hypothetical protein